MATPLKRKNFDYKRDESERKTELIMRFQINLNLLKVMKVQILYYLTQYHFHLLNNSRVMSFRNLFNDYEVNKIIKHKIQIVS